MRSILLAGAALAGIAGLAHGQSPSFNCENVRVHAQEAICRDGALARLDMTHEALFARILAAADATTRARMHRDYPLWQQFRDLCGADRLCIAQRYEARIGELERARNPVVLLEEVRPVRPAAPATGRVTGVLRTREVPNLRVLSEALGGDRVLAGRPALTKLELIAALATQGQGGAPAPTGASVDSDGTIRKPLDDGRIAYFNPLTGARGYINPDGTQISLQFLEVQPDTLPALLPDYSGWSTSVAESLSGLVGNLLTQPEAETLRSNAPPDFFENLDFQLKILAFISG